jgi:aldose 1-epimerase
MGFDKKVWRYISSGESPHPFLELKYSSADGEEGFPGKLETVIRFELNDANELSYRYTADCDRPTAINLTHHSYFNLDNSKGTIEDHEIKIYAPRFLEQDDKLIPTGAITPVANTAFDFCDFRRIGESNGKIELYDNSFAVEKREDQLVAEARSLRSNIQLQVYSTEPIVHFYTGKWIPAIKGKNGNHYGPFSGLCLETHKHPNAVNIPHFPNTILRPGETYYHKTIYKVIV